MELEKGLNQKHVESVEEGVPEVVELEAEKTPDSVNLENYLLTRDRARRTNKPTVRYGYKDLAAFAFSVVSTEDDLDTEHMLRL